MKVALLTDGIWPFIIGGMQRHSYLLCKYLAANAVSVIVFYPEHSSCSKEKLEEIFTPGELAYLHWVAVKLPSRFHFPGHYLYESWLYSRNIFRALQQYRHEPHFIYAQGLTGWYLLQHKRRAWPPVAVNLHGYEFMQLHADVKEKLKAKMLYYPFKLVNNKADYVISLGGKLTQYIRKLGAAANKVIEIPNAVENSWVVNEKSNRLPGPRRFAFLGRYERRKGIHELNQVLELLLKTFEFRFEFIGAIPDNCKLSNASVRYHGQITSTQKIAEILDLTDVLVCPSYSEGMPTVILEAMARGCAVIASDVGAVNLVVNEDTGWLIQPASQESLMKAIESAITLPDQELRWKSTRASHLVRENYTWSFVAKKMIETMHRLQLK